MNIFFDYYTLIFNHICIKLMVMEASIVLEVVRIAININVINQLWKLAFLRLIILSFFAIFHWWYLRSELEKLGLSFSLSIVLFKVLNNIIISQLFSDTRLWWIRFEQAIVRRTDGFVLDRCLFELAKFIELKLCSLASPVGIPFSLVFSVAKSITVSVTLAYATVTFALIQN